MRKRIENSITELYSHYLLHSEPLVELTCNVNVLYAVVLNLCPDKLKAIQGKGHSDDCLPHHSNGCTFAKHIMCANSLFFHSTLFF